MTRNEGEERPSINTALPELFAWLQVSEECSRAMLESSPDGISVVDQTGRILTCNEQFALMHGYAHSSEIIGKHAAEFATPGTYAGFLRKVAAAFAAGGNRARGIEVAVRKRDGTPMTTEYSVAQMPWPDAPAGVAFVSFVRDITKRKELLSDLEQHRSHLEDLVRERTRDLEAEITERVAAQKALERSKASLEEAERIAHLGSWEIDLATGELRMSDEMRRIFGFDRTDRPITRADLSNLVHPDDRGAVRAAMRRALEPDQIFRVQCRIVVPGGETHVIRVAGELFRDAAGQPARAHGMVQDVTERERVREALDQRVKDLSSLQALSSVANLKLSLEETIDLALQKIVTVAGLDMAKIFLLRENRLHLAGTRFGQCVPATQSTDLGVGECLCGLAVQHGRPMYAGDIEKDQRRSRDGCLTEGLRSVVALPLRSGETSIGALALGSATRDAFADRLVFLETAAEQIAVGLQNALLHQEIHERAAGLEEIVAERIRELQTERDRTQAILDTVGESVVVTDLDGQILFLNPATTRLTGYSRNELLGQPLWRYWSAQAARQTWPAAQEALRAGRTWEGEFTGLQKDGAVYTAMLTGTPLHRYGSGPLSEGGVWVLRDITAIKEAERLKDQFVSNVSHELRTPISIIALSCENLDVFHNRLDEDQRRQMLLDIHKQAYVLNDLVEDILLLSHIDSGRATARSRFDLAALVSEVAGQQQPLIEGRAQLLTLAAAGPVMVSGSPVQLRQVMHNLLDNAIKYTPVGGRIDCICEVRVVARAGVSEGSASSTASWAVIEVADNGIGISPEALPHLFDRFFRVHGEGGVPGVGLGLSIARELVRLHNGWIDVVSIPRQGSTFTVYLPLAD